MQTQVFFGLPYLEALLLHLSESILQKFTQNYVLVDIEILVELFLALGYHLLSYCLSEVSQTIEFVFMKDQDSLLSP